MGEVTTTPDARRLANNGTAIAMNGNDHMALGENDFRRGLVMSNPGSATVWVSYGTGAAAANHGFALPPNCPPVIDPDWAGEVHVLGAVGGIFAFAEKLIGTTDPENQ